MSVVTLANGRTFVAAAGTTLLDAAVAQGLVLDHSCRTGRCGTCKVRVTEGRTSLLLDESSLTGQEAEDGFILTCARQACSDLSLDAEDLGELAGLTPKTFPCRIDSIDRITPDVVAVRLRLPPAAGFAFLAGQYIDITGPGGVKRSYSIASSAQAAAKLELHIRRVDGGALSRYWFDEAKPNDLLRFRGPLGTFFLRDVAGLDLIFLATGTGYAPVHSMLASLQGLPAERRPRSTSLYWGGRLPHDIYVDPVGEHPALDFVPVLSRAAPAWDGARGHVQATLLTRHTRPLAEAAVYACGSDAMIHSARTALCAAGLNPRRFQSDAFVSSN